MILKKIKIVRKIRYYRTKTDLPEEYNNLIHLCMSCSRNYGCEYRYDGKLYDCTIINLELFGVSLYRYFR